MASLTGCATTPGESSYFFERMGLPIGKLVIATNQNDILHRCLTTGIYRTEGVLPSISPSMDIQVSSNFERAVFDAYGRDGKAVAQLMDDLKATGAFTVSQGALQALREVFDSGCVSEKETSATISATSASTPMRRPPSRSSSRFTARTCRSASSRPMTSVAVGVGRLLGRDTIATMPHI